MQPQQPQQPMMTTLQSRSPAGSPAGGGRTLVPPFMLAMSPVQIMLIGTTALLAVITIDVARRLRRLERGA